MRLTVLGSGGALVTPRPGCECRVCVSARARPEERRAGPSVYVHDARLLVDAPEDVVVSLNRQGIDRVDHLFITHWHPDHCAGLRVLETLTWDLATDGGQAPIDVWLNATTEARLQNDLRYFASKNYCRVHVVQSGAIDRLGPLEAGWFGYAADDFLTGVVLSDGRSRTLVAMDETRDLARHVERMDRRESLGGLSGAMGCDLVVVECGWLTQDAVGAPLGSETSSFRRTEAGFERDTLPLIRALDAKRTILVHINGDLMGHTPPELDTLAAQHAALGFTFARDGTQVTT